MNSQDRGRILYLEGPVSVACLGLLNMEKKYPPFYKNVNVLGKKNNLFFKIADMRTSQNRPFLSEIQNDDAYLLAT